MISQFCLVVLVIAVSVAGETTRWHQLGNSDYSFETFLREHSKSYSGAELDQRRALFVEELSSVIAHNKNSAMTWKRGINHMSDWTPEERAALLGYKKTAPKTQSMQRGKPDISNIPDHVDWREKGALTPVKDQGHCGSCWTFSAAAVLESAWFLKTGQLLELSEMQMASCSPNPQHCGGTGGCEGGTQEIAFQGVIDVGGIASQWTYPYISYNGTDYPCAFDAKTTPVVATIKSFEKLPENEYEPLISAVVNIGPIAISVDASTWHSYETGVFNGCNQTNPDINHAVTLVGYGSDASTGADYWIVRNSWTPAFGEGGFIRILRQSTDIPCGTDITPSHGTGCDPQPPSVTVCGTCGILFDSSYPIV